MKSILRSFEYYFFSWAWLPEKRGFQPLSTRNVLIVRGVVSKGAHTGQRQNAFITSGPEILR